MTRKRLIIWGYVTLLALTTIVGFLIGHDNQDIPPSQGWQPTFLLKFFNSSPTCKQLHYYASGSFACDAARNREDWLGLVLLSLTVVATIARLMYLVIRWIKKRR